MSAKPLEVRYWEGPASIGARRPCHPQPYGHLHRLRPGIVAIFAVVVNLAFGLLMLLGSQLPPEILAVVQGGDPNGSIAEIHFIHQPQPQSVPIPASNHSSEHSDESEANRPKASPAFAPEPNLDGEITDNAALKAVYRGQLQARLERTRPVQNSLASQFTAPFCRLRLYQDLNGLIREIEFLACTGSAEWRDALLSSIRSAAPLPMPPHAALHSRALEIEVGASISVQLISDDEVKGKGKGLDWISPEASIGLEGT